MDIRNVDLNLLKTAPIAGKKQPEASETAAHEADDLFGKETPFEDILSKFIDAKMEEQTKIDKGIMDPAITGQISSQMKLSMVDGFQRGGEKSDWNPAGIS
jgi:hypothetical protein